MSPKTGPGQEVSDGASRARSATTHFERVSRAESARNGWREIGQDTVASGAFECQKALHHAAVPVYPSVLSGCLYHRVFAGHLIGISGCAERVLTRRQMSR